MCEFSYRLYFWQEDQSMVYIKLNESYKRIKGAMSSMFLLRITLRIQYLAY